MTTELTQTSNIDTFFEQLFAEIKNETFAITFTKSTIIHFLNAKIKEQSRIIFENNLDYSLSKNFKKGTQLIHKLNLKIFNKIITFAILSENNRTELLDNNICHLFSLIYLRERVNLLSNIKEHFQCEMVDLWNSHSEQFDTKNYLKCLFDCQGIKYNEEDLQKKENQIRAKQFYRFECLQKINENCYIPNNIQKCLEMQLVGYEGELVYYWKYGKHGKHGKPTVFRQPFPSK